VADDHVVVESCMSADVGVREGPPVHRAQRPDVYAVVENDPAHLRDRLTN
jgi:hypothetical protein